MSNSVQAELTTKERVERGLRRRYRAEKRFQAYGIGALALGLGFLLFFFAVILSNGLSALQQTYLKIDIDIAESVIDPQGTRDIEQLRQANYQTLVRQSLYDVFPDVTTRKDKRQLNKLASGDAAFSVRDYVLKNQNVIGTRQTFWVLADDEVDMYVKGAIDKNSPEKTRRLKNQQLGWIDALLEKGHLKKKFNKKFFTSGDSREPEQAGIWSAAVGSFYTLIVTLFLSFPIGVAAAIYLEEFAPKNRWTDFIEVNINNLAAVPSIVFGLLGLAVFINWFGLPRSAPLVGGLVLSLMTLPVIIIASRAAIRSVPPSIKEAALSLGASHMQAVFHHVLPLAMPGMLTGTIIGMARALGESAPLLMIGMVAFIVEVPGTPLDPSTALPVQIYLWADSPERAFVERTSAAIIVLLGFLLLMNATAVLLRSRFEKRW